jgi:hypothetical protein
MERRLNKKIEDYLITLKNEIAKRLQSMVEGLDTSRSNGNSYALDETKLKCNSLAGFVYNYEKLRLVKDDFMKRKRVKSVVPMYERCSAKRANGEQCTRRKKDDEAYCGTHIKGTPHSIIDEVVCETPTTKNVKVDIWAQDIKGIIYYIDKTGNVYDTEDIMKIDKYPKRVIAKYHQDEAGKYSIPSMFGTPVVQSMVSMSTFV